jgi:hypothetical protein
MPDYYVIEQKLGPVRDVGTLPVVTADTPELAAETKATEVQRAGTFFVVEKAALVEVVVEAEVQRTFRASRAASANAPAV